MTVVREGRKVHDCTESIPAPNSHDVGAVAACEHCGRRWKLAKVGFSFKEWRRTTPTLLHDLALRRRAICRWAAVDRHVTTSR